MDRNSSTEASFQGLTAPKSSAVKTVAEFAKGEDAFRCRPSPSLVCAGPEVSGPRETAHLSMRARPWSVLSPGDAASCLLAPDAQPRPLPHRGNNLLKGQSRELQKPYIFLNISVSSWLFGLDLAWCSICHRNTPRGLSRSNSSCYDGQLVKSRGQTAG